jgi:hypothetical protein
MSKQLQRFGTGILLFTLLAGCAVSGTGGGTEGSGLVAPSARDDRVVVVFSADSPGAVMDLHMCTGYGYDSLGTPSGVVVSFGGGTSGIPETPAGRWSSVSDGETTLAVLSVSSAGLLTIVPEPDVAGSFNLTYSLSNDAGSSTATVNIVIESEPRAPVPVEDTILIDHPVTTPFSGEYSLRGNDDVGAPGSPVVAFALDSPVITSVGNLDSFILDQPSPFAGGSIMVSTGGRFVYKDWTYPGVYVFSYTLANDTLPNGAAAVVRLTVPGPPVAVDDNVSCKNIGKSKSLSFNVITGEDPAPSGDFRLSYTLANSHGESTAVVTFRL